MDTERFVPSLAYLTQALKSDFIRDYCRKWWSPSIYLVTGLKIAEKASVQSGSSYNNGGNVHATVDATALGVPLKAGPSAEASTAKARGNAKYIEGPFLLAYQLKRLKLKRDGFLKSSESFNKFALFDDSASVEGSAENDIMELWDMEDVEPNTDHNK